MTTSAIVNVNNTPLNTSGVTGYNAIAGSTVTVSLVNPANVSTWTIFPVNYDGYNINFTPANVMTTLMKISNTSYTFTAPNLIGGIIGGGNIWMSITNQGLYDQNVFTFGIWVLGTNNLRTFIGGEGLESNITVGIAYDLNAIVANVGVGSGTAIPSGPAGGGLGGTYPNPSVNPLTMLGDITGTTSASILSKIDGYSLPNPGNHIGIFNSTGSSLNWGNLSGDLTSSNLITTLATVNSNVGSFGSTLLVPVVTVNGKGLITAITTATLPTSYPPNGSAGGDLGGTYPNPTLNKIDGYSLPSPTPGVLTEASGSLSWTPLPAAPTTLPPNGPAGGDLSGTYPNPTVANIQGTPVNNGSLSDGYLLQYSVSQGKYLEQFYNRQVKTFLTNSTWVCPAGITSVLVYAACGGTSGPSAGTNSLGAQIATAAFVNGFISTTPGSSYTITVGAGGIGPAGTSTSGGTTSVDGYASTIALSGTIVFSTNITLAVANSGISFGPYTNGTSGTASTHPGGVGGFYGFGGNGGNGGNAVSSGTGNVGSNAAANTGAQGGGGGTGPTAGGAGGNGGSGIVYIIY